MIRMLVIVVCMGATSAVAAPQDFARGSIIQTMNEASVQRVTLPQDVYEWVVQPDLGDLRVYNADQEEVPYALQRSPGLEDFTPWVKVPVFALPVQAGSNKNASNVNIELGDGGAIVAVQGGAATADAADQFLLDASGLQEPIDGLKFDWKKGGDSFIGKFRVEVSDDLHVWRIANPAATIAGLLAADANGRKVLHDKIEVEKLTGKYLRLTQVDGSSHLSIDSISVRSRMLQRPVRHYKTLQASANDNGFEFDIGGHLPVDRVAVRFPGSSYLVDAHLFSRPNDNAKWRDRGSRICYKVDFEGMTVESDQVAYSIGDRYWRAEFAETKAIEPSLEVSWPPAELVFFTQGDPPYSLVYGRADFTGRQWPMADLLQRLQEVNGTSMHLAEAPLAGLSEPQFLGGPNRVVAAAKPIDWMTIALWSVLVAGVLLIGSLAIRLLKQ
jgi:hypothetical protein